MRRAVIVGLVLLGGGAAAGLFGSLLGLGGGILIVPLLTLALRPAAAQGGRRLASSA